MSYQSGLTISAGAGVGGDPSPGAGSLVLTRVGGAGVVGDVTVLTGPALLAVTPRR